MQYSTVGRHTVRVALLSCVLFISVLTVYGQSSSSNSSESGVKPGSTITLDQAIERATSTSLSARSSDINLAIARDANRITHGQNGINLSASTGYTHSAPYGTSSSATASNSLASRYPTDTLSAGLKASNGSASSPTTSLTLSGTHEIASTDPLYQISTISANLTQTIWDGYLGGKTFLSNNIADITLAQKILTRQSDLTSLIYQVKQAYYATANAQDAITLNRQILEQRQRDYDQTTTLFDAGKDTAVDVMQAEVNRETAQLNLSDAQDSLKSARQALSVLIGVPLEVAFNVETPADSSVPAGPVNSLINGALSHRIDLQQLVLSKESASLTTSLVKTSRMPVVTANAGISYDKDWNAKTGNGTWDAGINVNVPIYSSGTIRAQIDQAQLDEQSIQIQIDQLKQSIEQAVQENYDSVQSLSHHVQLAQKSVDLAQKQYELVQIQFRQGTMSQLDVLTDSVALSQARTNLQQAKSQLQLAILKLENSIGE